MAAFNKAILIGNLTRDPDLRYTKGGKAVCDFTIAINEERGATRSTLFMEITAWDRTAEACASCLAKGSLVQVEGRIEREEWQSADGEKRSKIKVTAYNVQFLTRCGREDRPAPKPAPEEPDTSPRPAPELTDDIPF